jgi:hypothetical protein
VEKFKTWSVCGDDLENSFTKDELLDNVMFYWLNAAATSSARLYWHSLASSVGVFDEVAAPSAYSRFPADSVQGRESVLLAWQRANVDELNRHARLAWGQLDRVSGPEIETPGGRRYAAGDHIVTLTPGPKGAWVTSERATVTSVNVLGGSLRAVTAEGRTLGLDRDATGGDRLGHGYAITAHRSQGATVDTAYVLEDGGGRELAYVAMSRARHASDVYAAAPDAEAVDRLGWAWGAERRETWATDRGRPTQPPVRP